MITIMIMIAVVTDDVIAIETAKQSSQGFTKRDQLKTTLVRRFQHVAGYPSDETTSCLATDNGIKNIPITRRDAMITKEMLSPSKYETHK